MEGERGAGGASGGGEKEDIRAGAFRHAGQHLQSGVDVLAGGATSGDKRRSCTRRYATRRRRPRHGSSRLRYKRITIERGTLHASIELLLGKDGTLTFLYPLGVRAWCRLPHQWRAVIAIFTRQVVMGLTWRYYYSHAERQEEDIAPNCTSNQDSNLSSIATQNNNEFL